MGKKTTTSPAKSAGKKSKAEALLPKKIQKELEQKRNQMKIAKSDQDRYTAVSQLSYAQSYAKDHIDKLIKRKDRECDKILTQKERLEKIADKFEKEEKLSWQKASVLHKKMKDNF